ncbi:hypothetical protein K469DRAFT_810131 [Zopfia rhizophila CBS 207.26]|uniref:Uncharacterized protein n=1 Tax=Zopfia rhizophila CBS 207.26 TaxID=1314779 RepID=A0A6A6DFD2_9PEZI|nr:hypothetical protein K469DRAFT_810131 [Zopfia rhizophila CBS 207.26]
MLFEIRYRKLFGVTATLWVLFAFTAFLNPTSAAPQQLFGNGLSRRAGEAPGIGVELEMGKIVIEGKRKLTEDEREKIKGAVMIPIDYDGAPKTNWELTAEIGTSIFPEAIVDGLKNKVGDRKTKGIGEEIFNFFDEWAPCAGEDSKVKIKGFDNLGPWIVKWPKQPTDLGQHGFGIQVTTAMPLEAILEILSDTKSKTPNPLASKGALDAPRIKILTKDDFKSFSKIKANDITDEFLGYFSLLTSYCVLAEFGNPNEGPKRLIPIMPRTDFVAQYTKFIEPKLKDQLSDGKTSLYDIIEKVSGAGSTLGKAEDLQTGTLEVEKFLNYLQGYDKATKKTLTQMDLVKLMDQTKRHGQIGSLGSKMETILGTSELVPIFESWGCPRNYYGVI